MTTPERPRFLADVMLGSLARWLRILGYDTVYDNQIEDDEIVHRCVVENRIALTRDVPLTERRDLPDALLIRSDRLMEQVREVLDYIGEAVAPDRFLTRCVVCNSVLESISKDAVRDEVPPYVFRTQQHFKRCPGCGRIYWGGTHREHILERLRDIT